MKWVLLLFISLLYDGLKFKDLEILMLLWRFQVEQLHKIFKLCGSPPEDYWRKLRLSTSFRPPQPYKPNIKGSFRDFPSSSLGLLKILLALDPTHRGSAASALQNEVIFKSSY